MATRHQELHSQTTADLEGLKSSGRSTKAAVEVEKATYPTLER